MENYYVSDILFTIFYYIVNISEKYDQFEQFFVSPKHPAYLFSFLPVFCNRITPD